MAAVPALSDGDEQAIFVTAGNVDLGNCDREIIHTPGLIQPHGAMLVLRASDLTILQASENTPALLGSAGAVSSAAGLVGLLGAAAAAEISAAIIRARDRLDDGPHHLARLPAAAVGQFLDVVAHRAGDLLILELEPVGAPEPSALNLVSDLDACIVQLRAATGLRAFLDVAAAQISAISGFDRVMAYQFAEDGSGEVVAETKREGLTSYLGMHFPASDIPAPARRLFALSWLRHLPDVNYTPVRMLPAEADQPDMSRALLRHVSVMYSSYLKNMGVHATMVLPLMKAGRLWGLMSCMHHSGPRLVRYETRTVIEILAQMVSMLMAEQEGHENAAYRRRMKDAIADLDRQMATAPVYHHGLSGGPTSLLGWLDARGAAWVTGDDVVLFGETPTTTEVFAIAAWLGGRGGFAPVFATDRLAKLYPAASNFKTPVAGVLAIRLMQNRHDFVLWFRPEIIQTVHWAGDPSKPVQIDVVDGQARLTPRGSFALWKETLPGRSEQWQECEIEAAGALRQVIAEVLLARLNEELGRSNVELDNFAYVASHDLKEPLRGIHNYALFLQRSVEPRLTEEERNRLQTIIRLTRRMDDLTDSLMQYSHIGRINMRFEDVDLNTLLSLTLEQLAPRINETGVVVVVPRSLPRVQSDPMRLAEVFSNLIVNAMKYNERPKGEGRIEIGWRSAGGPPVFTIHDNGIGIAERHLEDIFKVFRRLHARGDYGGGSGAGLSIARRTIERLGGRLWAESEGLGRGATFLFTLGVAATDAVPP